MPSRRTLLTLAAGTTALLAGCGGTGGSDNGSLGIETADVTAAPGDEAAVEVTATAVSTLTYSIEDIPQDWQVTHGDFDPQPSAVRESYPPQLVWDPLADSTTGTLTVSIPSGAAPGEHELPVEVGAEDGEENAVSTATITVES